MNKNIFLSLTFLSFTGLFCDSKGKKKPVIDTFILKYSNILKNSNRNKLTGSFYFCININDPKISDIKEHLSKVFETPKEKIEVYESLTAKTEMAINSGCSKCKCLIVM